MEDRYMALFKNVRCEGGYVRTFIGRGSTEEEAVNRLYRTVLYHDEGYIPLPDEVEHKKKFTVLDLKTGYKARMIYCVVTFHYVFDKGRADYEQVKSELDYRRTKPGKRESLFLANN